MNNMKFEYFIMLMIVVSGVQLAMDTPLNDPESSTYNTLVILDRCITVVFTLEAIFRIIMVGFLLNGKHSYLRNPWNIVDFIIVIFSVNISCFT